jgi:hypothetical protein
MYPNPAVGYGDNKGQKFLNSYYFKKRKRKGRMV